MTNYLLAGGGTAGHVNPLLALADRIKLREPDSQVIALGTVEGLESRLVPLRGYELATVARLPFPRKLNRYALEFPGRYTKAVASVRELIRERKIDVVVGFGGYASAPAYEAARAEKVPFVIHEANALPGLANRRGARHATAVAVTFDGTKLKNAELVGMPLRSEIEALIGAIDKSAARKHFGLSEDTATLLVTGGSLGAKRINETVEASRHILAAAGIQVLHITGDRSDLPEVHESNYVRLGYCDRMELAISAADVALARSGATTVSELTALGLPAIYVPYPVGNGEQALNAKVSVAAGGALLVNDADFDLDFVKNSVVPLVSNSRRLAAMSEAAASVAIKDGTERLYRLVAGLRH
jgi:UDP-N-acetylglucosamine--N-acetylmuramyl-(pentapeptide) pyrophosphoryl-undecaprenol N-acetylglucosamine transferase